MPEQEFETIIVLHCGTVVLRSFEEVREYVVPPENVRAIGIAMKIKEARTDDEKAAAVSAFRVWANATGLLVSRPVRLPPPPEIPLLPRRH
jgi:hypothetical protein